MTVVPDEDDEIDGCELDFAEDAVDDETVDLLPLFPDGVADDRRAEEWRELFGQGTTGG